MSPDNITVDWTEDIPMGFRFCPTDDEAFVYLFYRINSKREKNILLHMVRELDVYERQPCELLSKEEEFSYYFTHRSVLCKSKINRNTRDGKGYWRITSTNSKFMPGKKNTLVYYLKSKDERGKGRKTNWIMHEYVLCKECSTTALCRIYERKDCVEKEMREKVDIFNWTAELSDSNLKRKFADGSCDDSGLPIDESNPLRQRHKLRPIQKDDLDHKTLNNSLDEDSAEEENNVKGMNLARSNTLNLFPKMDDSSWRSDRPINNKLVKEKNLNFLNVSLQPYHQRMDDTE